MENSYPLILEISSDEESGFGDARKGDFGGVRDGYDAAEDHDWLSKLLCEVDGNKDDDSDEVLVVSEVISNPKSSRLPSSKPACEIFVCSGGDDEDDDDCVIVDSEPDKAGVVENRGVNNHDGGGGGGDDSDDLEILGEKGEVACRDFPHARHLCANFAFGSTPHDVHCGQCHCYVCDSVAPCAHWGTGISSTDHCHATDKEDYWRNERKRVKKGDQPVLALTGTIDAFYSAGLPQTIELPALLPIFPNSSLQNKAVEQVSSGPCSMSSNVNMPDSINQSRSHEAGRVVPRYKYQRVRTTWRSGSTSVDNNHDPVNRVPQLIHRPAFKRTGFVEDPPKSRPGYNRWYYGAQVSRGSPLRRCPSLQTPGLYHAANFPRRKFPVPHSINAGSENYRHLQPQIHSQPRSSSAIRDPVHCQPHMPSQPYVSDNFESAITSHAQMLSQRNLEDSFENMVPPQPNKIFQSNFPITSHAMFSEQLDSGNEYGNQMHPTQVIPSPSNQSSLFQEYDENVDNQRSCHLRSPAPPEHRHLIDDNGSHFPVNPDPNSLNFRFDNWTVENQSFPGDLEVSPMSPGMNVFSPEPASLDSGTPFDY